MCVVNTATAATQMSRERARPYRALCTPAMWNSRASVGLEEQGAYRPPKPTVQRSLGPPRWARSQPAVSL